MTTGVKVALAVAAAGGGFVVWRVWGRRWWLSHVGFGAGAAPLTDPSIATLPVLPDLVAPSPRPLGQTEDFPPGFGVVVSSLGAMRGSPPPPPPPPPPPIEIATSVGNLWVPPTISQQQALSKVDDLKAIYLSGARPEDESAPSEFVAAPAARRGRGHF